MRDFFLSIYFSFCNYSRSETRTSCFFILNQTSSGSHSSQSVRHIGINSVKLDNNAKVRVIVHGLPGRFFWIKARKIGITAANACACVRQHRSPFARLYIRVCVTFRVSVRAGKNSCGPEYVSSPINSQRAGFLRQRDRQGIHQSNTGNFVNNRVPAVMLTRHNCSTL